MSVLLAEYSFLLAYYAVEYVSSAPLHCFLHCISNAILYSSVSSTRLRLALAPRGEDGRRAMLVGVVSWTDWRVT